MTNAPETFSEVGQVDPNMDGHIIRIETVGPDGKPDEHIGWLVIPPPKNYSGILKSGQEYWVWLEKRTQVPQQSLLMTHQPNLQTNAGFDANLTNAGITMTYYIEYTNTPFSSGTGVNTVPAGRWDVLTTEWVASIVPGSATALTWDAAKNATMAADRLDLFGPDLTLPVSTTVQFTWKTTPAEFTPAPYEPLSTTGTVVS